MKRTHPAISVTSYVAVSLLYLPMLAVAAYSVNSSKTGATWTGFTLHWYAQLLDNPTVIHAALNTAILAVVSSTIATIIGTTLAIGLDRFPWPRMIRRFLDTILYLPVVMPDVLFAAALLVIFFSVNQLLGWFELGMRTMIFAHVTFQIAFVTLIVRARIATLDKHVEEAARDLYASNWCILKRITLPLLAPAILGGFLLAFTLSLDDFVVSFFTNGDTTTLPILIHSSAKRGVSAELHALTMVIFVLTILLVLVVQLFSRDPRTENTN